MKYLISDGANQPEKPVILTIDNLSIAFKSSNGIHNAVGNLSFHIYSGEWFAIVGESGSGKSATALSIPLLFPPDTVNYTGKILLRLKNESIVSILTATQSEMAAIRGKEVAVVFQEPMSALNPLKTIGSQISEAIIQHKNCSPRQAQAETIELCKQVALPFPEKIIKRYPHQLSGGQKQRVMIAIAISCQPRLLICDEPTTGLDADVQHAIVALLRQLQKTTGLSILFITHDLGLVEGTADRIMVMQGGEMAELNTAEALFNRPQNNYTKALLACRPSLYNKGTKLPVVQDFLFNELSFKKQDEQFHTTPSLPINSHKPLIEVKNLSVTHYKNNAFGKRGEPFKAVDDISFNIYKGEILGLSGPSGSGKSTIGRALLHLIPSEPGSAIWYEGTNLSNLSAAAWKEYRRKLQIIFQDPIASLNPIQTIGRLLEEPMLVHPIYPTKQARKERIQFLLDHIQLPTNILRKYPHEFSGGQRQRISIARALTLHPEFIVCDEVVASLDVSVQAQILNLLNDLKDKFQLTLLFISHDMAVVKYFCDRIIRLKDGKLSDNLN